MAKKHGHVRTLGGTTLYRLIYAGGKQRLEHRVVMEKVLGRPLGLDEVVHHKDEDGLNNDPINLELMTRAEHRRIHGGPRWSISLGEAVAMRDSGASLEDIGSEAGVTWTAVHHVFRRRGIPTKDLRHGTVSWDLDLALRLKEEGASLVKIGKAVGASHTTVRKTLVKYGETGEKPRRR